MFLLLHLTRWKRNSVRCENCQCEYRQVNKYVIVKSPYTALEKTLRVIGTLSGENPGSTLKGKKLVPMYTTFAVKGTQQQKYNEITPERSQPCSIVFPSHLKKKRCKTKTKNIYTVELRKLEHRWLVYHG